MKWLRKSSRYFKNLKILIMESDLDIRRLDKREHLEKWLDFLECAFKEKASVVLSLKYRCMTEQRRLQL